MMLYTSPKCPRAVHNVQDRSFASVWTKSQGWVILEKGNLFFHLKVRNRSDFLLDENMRSLICVKEERQDWAQSLAMVRLSVYGTELWFSKVYLRITWRSCKNEESSAPLSVILIQLIWTLTQVSAFLTKHFRCCFKVDGLWGHIVRNTTNLESWWSWPWLPPLSSVIHTPHSGLKKFPVSLTSGYWCRNISSSVLGREPLVTTQIFPSESTVKFFVEKRVRLQVIANLD